MFTDLESYWMPAFAGMTFIFINASKGWHDIYFYQCQQKLA